MLLAAPLAQLIDCWALLTAAVAESFRWRRIDYQIVGRTGLRILGYTPYRPRKEPEEAPESV